MPAIAVTFFTGMTMPRPTGMEIKLNYKRRLIREGVNESRTNPVLTVFFYISHPSIYKIGTMLFFHSGNQLNTSLKSEIFENFQMLSGQGLIQLNIESAKKIFSLDEKMITEISRKLGLLFISGTISPGNVCMANNPEVRPEFRQTFSSSDLLNYIYGVLHSSAWLSEYKSTSQTSFLQLPFPQTATFWQLVELGGQLRKFHLLELPKVNEFITSYPVDGNNTVTCKMTTKSIGWEPTNKEKTTGRVWINDTRYFDCVPLVAWEFYIGGYQPAQKWLTDRHGRTLSFEDILQYQKIIFALAEIHRLMQEIDLIFRE